MRNKDWQNLLVELMKNLWIYSELLIIFREIQRKRKKGVIREEGDKKECKL